MTRVRRLSFVTSLACFALFTVIAAGPAGAEINCAGGKCDCSGDKDCNTMFTHLCTDTGGSCNNDNNTCTCTQKLTATSGSGGKKIVPGAEIKSNKKMNKY